MRTNEERIAALHERAGEIRRHDRARLVRIVEIGSTAACVIFIVALAAIMPEIKMQFVELSSGGLIGSIFTDNEYLGYVVVGIVALMLGSVLTMFLFKLKQWQGDRNREEETR